MIGFYRFFEKGCVIVGVGGIGCIVDVARVCAKFSTNWSGAKTISPPHAERHKAAMEKADKPLEYDYGDGWTANYEQPAAELEETEK